MPEYSHIQTYIKCNEENFKENLLKLKLLLKEIGFNDNYILENCENIEWVEEENGFIYTGCGFNCVKFDYYGFSLKLRPLVLGWTPRISDDIKESWLELELLFESEEISWDYGNGRLKDGIKEQIVSYMITFSKYFNETGTYFTDEVTDGMPWKSLTNIGGYTWAFDIAIIPSCLEYLYSDMPTEFTKQMIQDKYIYIGERV